MPKKSTRRAAKDQGASASRRPAPEPKGDGNKHRWKTIAVWAVLVVVAGGFLVWHRQRDPIRTWARRMAHAREEKVTRRLMRCFGGHDAASVRKIIPEIRRGNWPAPFRDCRSLILSETVASPMDFAAELLEPPGPVETAQAKERDHLERLRSSLANLQRIAGDVPRDSSVPQELRDRMASALEDLAVDLDGERQAFEDLMEAAESAASLW